MKKIAIILTTLILSGCVSSAERQRQQAEIDRTIPLCSSQKQCDAAWAAARQWVNQNCGMKIQNYSSDYIETYNSPADSAALACQVTKNPLPNGASAINLRTSCSNMFGCVPDTYQSIINFNNYVNKNVEQFAPVKMGFTAIMSDINGHEVKNTSYSSGMVIMNVNQGGSAYKAGLRRGDIITSLGNDAVRNQRDMTSAMEKYHSGDNVNITILRNGKTLVQEVNL
ncbi:PDZ domain-containing protein [Edwardsiella piscicida]|uniref:PDZ domain-containing protein n=1 Tax=Edwardsiella piscicida TaxID=1263550 RepID=UPI0020C87EE5|nr:PDZ domain-containing protein [Edwardsiella piscicida]WAM43692.1 PDZ domain-containing protein [Edwardsiella piscicida]